MKRNPHEDLRLDSTNPDSGTAIELCGSGTQAGGTPTYAKYFLYMTV
jgi:hypothetical protein